MKVVAIIQARMRSGRLPGKVLAEIAGRSMLCRVCDRTGQARAVDQVVVATTPEPDDDQIVDECDRLHVACFRGSAEDVLDRYHKAAGTYAADVVVRVTADCPLIDPGVIDLVVLAFLEAHKGGQGNNLGTVPIFAQRKWDCPPPKCGSYSSKKRACPPSYASNTLKRTWPRGLDTEVMAAAALGRACREAAQPYQRTHVTPYIYQHPESFRLLAVTGPENLAQSRWTVDWPEDLELVRAICGRLGDRESFSWRDVQRLLARQPALAELNRHVRQRQLVEG